VTAEASDSLSPAERGSLLRLARLAIGERLFGDGRLAAALRALDVTPALGRPAAVFVTLKRPDPAGAMPRLRGCIGVLEATLPLYSEVVLTARRAAFEDPRFPPLAAEELDVVTIELSILGPLLRLASPDGIIVGRHGVQLVSGVSRALFLPQVALEQGWDRERLLAQLSRKAGLDDQAWRSADLFVFRTESFGEVDQPRGG
jgi:hypothetical protein